MKLVANYYISYAHKLPDSEDLHTKQCSNLHGHEGKVKVEIEGEPESTGMIVDFGRVKEIVNELDHTYLNDIFGETPATAENIAVYLKTRIEDKLGIVKSPGDSIPKVKVWFCEGYKGEENSNWVVTS